MDLTELIKRDSIEAHWFWVISVSDGPYEEHELFDVSFVRDTSYMVGGGYFARRTLHIKGIGESINNSRRANGGEIIYPNLPRVLAHVIADAHQVSEYDRWQDWAQDTQDHSLGYVDALNDYERWETHRARHAQIREWLGGGDDYRQYVAAAQEYAAEH